MDKIKQIKALINELNKELPQDQPYLITFKLSKRRKFNPAYDINAICKCGHSYYRHFDSYDNQNPIGCKYCPCHTFELQDKPIEE